MPTYNHFLCQIGFGPQRSAYLPSFSSGEAIFDPPLFLGSTSWSGGGPGPHFKACRPKPAHKPSNRGPTKPFQEPSRPTSAQMHKPKGGAENKASARKVRIVIFEGSVYKSVQKPARPTSPEKGKPRGGERRGLGPKGGNHIFLGSGKKVGSKTCSANIARER